VKTEASQLTLLLLIAVLKNRYEITSIK